jgi:hypothetical protein
MSNADAEDAVVQPSLTPGIQSDFSLRKMRIALIVLMGTLFGSSILPMMALSLLLMPMTQEFGWSRTAFSGGMTALMWCGALCAPFLGRMVDRFGVRRMIIGGTGRWVDHDRDLIHAAGISTWDFRPLRHDRIGYPKVLTALFTQHREGSRALRPGRASLPRSCRAHQSLISDSGWRLSSSWPPSRHRAPALFASRNRVFGGSRFVREPRAGGPTYKPRAGRSTAPGVRPACTG